MTRTAVAAVALAVLGLPYGSPAAAHTGGGQAQLYVGSARLEPQGEAWALLVQLRDADSGALQPGFALHVSGSGPSGQRFGPLLLTDSDNDGRYQSRVPLTPGRWWVTVEAREIPGGQLGLPFTKTWTVALHPGKALDISGRAVRPGDSDGGITLGRLSPAVGVTAVGLAAAWFIGRRRKPTLREQ